ncbi:MAG: hypothetical protein AAGA54_18030 [Myxococcota bacterium]
MRLRVLAFSSLLLAACGDDGGGGETDTDALLTAGVGSGPPPTSAPPPDTFPNDDGAPDTFPDDDDDPTTLTDTTPDPTTATSPATTDPDPTTDPATTEPDPTDSDTGGEEPTTGIDTEDPPTDGETDPTDPTVGDGGSCCDVNPDAMGCDDEAITQCVCEEDPFCCENGWDDACIVGVVIYGCATCEGVGGEGDCCSGNGTPGCDDDAIEACVCQADTVCCLEAWDETCAQGVEFEDCGTCP